MRTLVTGATGYIGSRLVAALLADGHHVTVASRNLERLGDFGWIDDVTPVMLDAGDPETVTSAFGVAGPVDVVYYLVHGIGQPGFRDADNEAAANVAQAAKAASVKRIVYLGGFVPDDGELSEHLTSRAEVAEALTIDGGPEVVWIGAAIILGAGSTSFELLRYVSDRFLLIPMPPWANNELDPISISDVLYYLVAAADAKRVPPGSYDIKGPETTTYGDLLLTFARLSGKWRTGVPMPDVDMRLVSQVAALFVPVPGGLAADLVKSLDYPMTASNDGLRSLVPDPPGGLVGVEDAIRLSLSDRKALPVDRLANPHHLADTDPDWAGGDVLRLRKLAAMVVPSHARPALGLLGAVPGPVAGWWRTGLDTLLALGPRGSVVTSLVSEIGAIVRTPAVPHHEPPSTVRRRRIFVVIVLILGATLLGISLRSTPGDTMFYVLTLALAAVWAGGARLSGQLHLGCVKFRGRHQRPWITGTVIGLLLGGVFIVGGLVCREIGPVRDYIVQVLDYANYGALWLVVLITVINGLAEEMFFRGALYTALGKFHPEIVSTVIYALAVSAAGNPMLGFAGIILGGVCSYERRITGGVLAPMLTHFFWGLVMVLALPPMFGV